MLDLPKRCFQQVLTADVNRVRAPNPGAGGAYLAAAESAGVNTRIQLRHRRTIWKTKPQLILDPFCERSPARAHRCYQPITMFDSITLRA
jgi:hypothetical protein